jgi:hypothetical protein
MSAEHTGRKKNDWNDIAHTFSHVTDLNNVTFEMKYSFVL